MSGLLDPLVLVLVRLADEPALAGRVPQGWSRCLTLTQGVLDDCAAQHGGERVEADPTGWLFVFPSVGQAVAFTGLAQRDLLDVDWPPTVLLRDQAATVNGDDGRVLFRGPRAAMAVHVGWARRHRNLAADGAPGDARDLVIGPGVHQAARIVDVAHGGQVLLDDVSLRGLSGGVGAAVVRDLGGHALLGVPGEARLHNVLPASLDAREFPPLMTVASRGTDVPPGDLDRFGREGDLLALDEVLSMGVRLVSIIGPSGIGKSRLARSFALRQVDYFGARGGVWWCDLRGVTNLDGMVQRLGETLDLPLAQCRSSDEAILQIGMALAARGELLLVLDGFDGLRRLATQTLGRALRGAPDARGVCTVRERLGLPGEVAYRVGALPLMSHTLDTPDGPAVRLYDATVARRQPGARTSANTKALVGRIGGAPQAVLWAAGIDAPPEVVLERLMQRGGDTATAVLRLALDALPAYERAVVTQLCAFPAHFDRSAVRRVVRVPDEARRPDAALDALVAAGLVERVAGHRAPGLVRYLVPEAVVVLLVDELTPAERRALLRRMALHVLDACEPWVEAAWLRGGAEAIAWVATESPTLLGVTRLGSIEDADAELVDFGLRAVLVVRALLQSRGPLDLLLSAATTALAAADRVLGADPLLQLRVLTVRADVLLDRGQLDRAEVDINRADAIAERWGDQEGHGLVALLGGRLAQSRGDYELAAHSLNDAVTQFSGLGARRLEGMALGARGRLALERGLLAEAEVAFREAVSRLREGGFARWEAIHLTNLGVVYRRLGRYAEARSLYREALALHRRAGELRLEGLTRCNVAQLDYHQGQLDQAALGGAQALALACAVGDRHEEARCLMLLGVLEMELHEFEAARRRLLRALALMRSGQEPSTEAAITGYLGLLYHFSGKPDIARDHYQRAVQGLEDARDRWYEVLFRGWHASLEAEQHDYERARTIAALARLRVDDVGDLQLVVAVDLLVELVEIAAARHDGQSTEPAAERAQALVAQLDRKDRPLDGVLRLARLRFATVLDRIAAAPTS